MNWPGTQSREGQVSDVKVMCLSSARLGHSLLGANADHPPRLHELGASSSHVPLTVA